jgi:hypothetical protein
MHTLPNRIIAKPERKRPLGRFRGRSKNDTRTDLKGTGHEVGHRTGSSEDGIRVSPDIPQTLPENGGAFPHSSCSETLSARFMYTCPQNGIVFVSWFRSQLLFLSLTSFCYGVPTFRWPQTPGVCIKWSALMQNY